MKVLIAGSGKTLYFLGRNFAAKGYAVVIINSNKQECVQLARQLPATVVCGDASDAEVLEDAGARGANAVLAITPNDQDNLVICQLASLKYGVQRTVALANDPDNAEVFEKLGVSAFSTTHIVGSLIEQRASVEQIRNLLPVAEGRVNVTEVILAKDSPVAGKFLNEISLPDNALIAVVIRDNQPIVPRGSNRLFEGDRVVLISIPENYGSVLRVLMVIKNRGDLALREKEYLKNRYAEILSSIGLILILCAVVMLLPLLVLIGYPHEVAHALAFLVPASGLAALGAVLWIQFHTTSGVTLTLYEGGIIVLVSWLLVVFFSSIPFMSVLSLPFSRAFFESMSGWTTTGLSVVDVSQAGKMILFWRSITQLAGGAGLAIIMVSAIVGPTGVWVSSAEGRSDQLVPHVRKSARLVLVIYVCYAMAGTFAYLLTGMSLFDAVNHAFAAVSTGGFSTQTESIGHWNSAAIEAVTLPLMLLGNLSFITAWFLWHGELRVVAKNSEVRLLMFIVPLFAVSLFLLTCQTIYPQLGKSVRVAVFETVSAITTTGFSTVGYGNWNPFGVFLLIILMLIGGGTSSTAGGIKQFRIYLMVKMIFWEIKRHLLPKGAVQERPVWEGNRRVFFDETKGREVAVFVFLYVATCALGVMMLCACGYKLSDSLFEFASALGTVGLSVGVTSAKMPDLALWAETVAMFLGRLEFMVIIISLLKLGNDFRVIIRH